MGNERGTSTLEMVVVLPCLLMILFGIVELSRAWLMLNLATTAVREGARVGVVQPGDQFPNPQAAMDRIDQILPDAGYPGKTRSVTCSTNPCAPDSIVTATVNVEFHTVVPVLLPMLETLNIQQTATMRFE